MRLTASASPTHIETGAIIRKALDWVNPYVSFLRHVRSDLEAPLAAGHYVSIHMLQPDPVNGPDPRRYNRPTAAEVAAVVVNLSPTSTSGRDIIITYNDGLRRHVNEQHRSFLALRFPILNPYGQSATSAGTTRSRWVVTLLKNYFPQTQSYMPPLLLIQIHLHVRPTFSTLLHAKTLLQEYFVDAWVIVEGNRLKFLRFNQAKIRADLYNGFQDAPMNGND
ncbi:unnamed protein product [Tilletia controversa]|nr:unnamed protein product [Tilletia controversa]